MATNEWLTPAEAGAILGVGPDRVAQLAKNGMLGSMHTPGGHVRVRRDDVEQLANPPAEPQQDDEGTDEPEESEEVAAEANEPAPSRPRWEGVPPWKRRVREAEADLKVLGIDDERERLLEGRTERLAQRDRAEAQRATAAKEGDRLEQLKSFALGSVPWGVPAEVKAEVARRLAITVTSEKYPATLGTEHAHALVRSEVERQLRPWRAKEARHERVRAEARERDDVIGWAVLKVRGKVPREWDHEDKRRLEREVRQVLEEEFQPGMEQDEANDIALDVLEEWLDGDDDES